jgi:hypothetical protein
LEFQDVKTKRQMISQKSQKYVVLEIKSLPLQINEVRSWCIFKLPYEHYKERHHLQQRSVRVVILNILPLAKKEKSASCTFS